MAKQKKRTGKSFGKRLLYWTSHFVCAISVILLFLTLVQCTIEKPEAPSWETNLVLPLVNRTWNMPEIIDKIDQESISTDSLGNPIFLYETVMDTVYISDGGSFAIADVSQSVAESLGVITLDPFPPTGDTVQLSDFINLAILQSGTVPAIGFTVSKTLTPISEFSSATVSNGYLVSTIVNDFGLDLDVVDVTIIDAGNGDAVVATYSIPGGVSAGSTSIDSISLAGRTISNQLAFDIYCRTVATVTFALGNPTFSAMVGMPGGLQVSSAVAEVPEISYGFSQSFDIASNHLVESATLASGNMILFITNNTNLSSSITLTIADILQPNGSPFTVTQSVAASATVQFTYDISGYSLEPSDQSIPQSISFAMDAVINASVGQVPITSGHNISVTAGIENITLSEIQGVISPTNANFNDLQQDIEIPAGLDQMQLPASVLTLKIENGVDLPGTLSITLTGDQGQQKTITGSILPGDAYSPVASYIIDSTMGDLMNPIPATITISGNATFGDGVTSGHITPDGFVVGSITLSSPMEVIIDSTTFDGGYEDSDIDIDSAIVESFISANFNGTFVNHLPIAVNILVLLGPDSATLYTPNHPDVISIGPVSIASGQLNPDGTVASATESENVVSIDGADLQILLGDSLWMGELITFPGTGGNSVKLSASDWLSITSYLEVNFKFNEDLVD